MKQGAKVANTGRATDAPTTVNTVANQVFRLALFDHLPRKQVAKDPDSVEADRVLHLATIHLGLLFNKGLVQADDDRAEATGRAFLQIIQDYKTPPNKVLREDLDRYISKQVQYWVENRQISKSMGNVIKFVRSTISKISPELSEADAKASLLSDIRSFIDDKIVFARESVARYVTQTINDDDVILTFGSSPLIRQVLLYASHQRKFRLIVVDTRPLNEGLQTLAALSDVIHCVYSPLSGAPVALKEVNKVILGASCLLSNGSMLAPAGTAMVAALAKQRQIPVIVASESYKFSEKVQLDSIVFNELGHASEIVSVSKPGGTSTTNDQEIYSTTFQASTTSTYSMAPQRQAGYRGSADKVSLKSISDGRADANNEDQIDHTEFIPVPQQQKQVNFSTIKLPFEVVNLRYDLTPITNISVIATETGLIPPTSIPVLIRENQNDHKHN